MIKKIFLITSLFVLSVSVYSQTAWTTLPSKGSGSTVAPSASITFTNLDSLNDTYSAWTSDLAYFMGASTGVVNTLTYKYDAGANDSIYFWIEGRIAGNENLVVRVYSKLLIGATTPVAAYVTLTDSANCDQYRIRMHLNQNTVAPNASTDDCYIGFGTNQMPYIAPKETWNGSTR